MFVCTAATIAARLRHILPRIEQTGIPHGQSASRFAGDMVTKVLVRIGYLFEAATALHNLPNVAASNTALPESAGATPAVSNLLGYGANDLQWETTNDFEYATKGDDAKLD